MASYKWLLDLFFAMIQENLTKIMENRFLIDLAIKYGLNDGQIGKIMALGRLAGASDDEGKFKRIAEYLCENGLVDEPEEELIEELKLKKIV